MAQVTGLSNYGVATAAGAEALPKPQERDNYVLEDYLQKILRKN